MDADELKRLLDESQDSIIAGVKSKIIERVSSNYEWEIAKLVNEQVKAFFEAEVAPEIAKALAGEKGAIIEAAKQASAQITVKLAEKMFELAQKNMDTNYKFERVLKELFA